jgi:pyrimidine-nucleoside phosphorylase
VDKHSTGGVGDKVSLVLAPMVAACGVPVPMVSGRGLGHTGGTLDKLEAIPGMRTDLGVEEFRAALAAVGVVMAGQTATLAPADRKMYALRDVTATIESVPLIAGSILSKKLAAGIDALVLDVKTGNGAFMPRYDDSLALAQTLVGLANRMGKRTIGFVTDMSQPLGRAVGNWLEVVEAAGCLRGKQAGDLMEVTLVLGGAMVYLGGKAESIAAGMQACRSALWSGRAYETFLQMVERQGGDPRAVENPSRYPAARMIAEVRAEEEGYVTGFDTQGIGQLAGALGAGRRTMTDRIDPKAGIVLVRKRGDRVSRGDVLAMVHADAGDGDAHAAAYRRLVRIGPEAPPVTPAVITLVEPQGVTPWSTPREW